MSALSGGYQGGSRKTGEAEGALLEARGGVNVSIAICMFVCYMIIVNIPLVFIAFPLSARFSRTRIPRKDLKQPCKK